MILNQSLQLAWPMDQGKQVVEGIAKLKLCLKGIKAKKPHQRGGNAWIIVW
jgi:hypothetical protein